MTVRCKTLLDVSFKSTDGKVISPDNSKITIGIDELFPMGNEIDKL